MEEAAQVISRVGGLSAMRKRANIAVVMGFINDADQEHERAHLARRPYISAFRMMTLYDRQALLVLEHKKASGEV